MDEDENKTIVFIETKRRVDEITRKIKRHGCVRYILLEIYLVKVSKLYNIIIIILKLGIQLYVFMETNHSTRETMF